MAEKKEEELTEKEMKELLRRGYSTGALGLGGAAVLANLGSRASKLPGDQAAANSKKIYGGAVLSGVAGGSLLGYTAYKHYKYKKKKHKEENSSNADNKE